MMFRTKIMAIILGMVLVAVFLVTATSNQITTHRVRLYQLEDGKHDPLIPISLVESLGEAHAEAGWRAVQNRLSVEKSSDFLVLDVGGTVRASNKLSMIGAKTDSSGKLVAAGGKLQLMLDIKAAPQVFSGSELIGHVISLPRLGGGKSGGDLAGSINRRLWLAAAFILAMTAVLGWVATRRALKPIHAISTTIDKMRGGDDTVVVPISGKDEIAQIGKSLNLLLAEQRHSKQVRQSLLTDLAHELRTPLTGIRCQAETLVDGLKPASEENLRALLDGVLQLQALYSDLEALAMADAEQLPAALETVSLKGLVEDCCRTASMQPDSPHFVIEVQGKLAAHADPRRLRQIILNLLSNAARVSSPTGNVYVTAQGLTEDTVVIDVRDEGAGVSVEAAEHIFARFYRDDPARNPNDGGHGLGLAIAEKLVTAMKGTVALTNAGEKGACFRVTLPAADG